MFMDGLHMKPSAPFSSISKMSSTTRLTAIGVKEIIRNGQELFERLKPQSALAIA